MHKNLHTESLLIELVPKNESGQESIFIIVKDNHITLSFDYFEKRYEFNKKTYEKSIGKIYSIVEAILAEKLLAVTTYSSDINLTKVSDLDKPSELKKRSRKKNFRSRSWFGTYDDDFK